MATVVVVHAHPDDEAILTGGTMARAADEGHRVVLVVATGGEHGEVPDDLGDDETLADRRRAELAESAEILGVAAVVHLGYRDSGMTGWDANDHPASFVRADLDEAAGRLADVVIGEAADVLVVYDWHGNYGHPDHVRVHHVGHRAAELARGHRPDLRVFEATSNRDAMARFAAEARARGLDVSLGDDGETFDAEAPLDDGNPFGMPEDELTHEVDVSAYVERKRAAIVRHRSQVSDVSFFSTLPPEAFELAFGQEWFIEVGQPAGMRRRWLLEP